MAFAFMWISITILVIVATLFILRLVRNQKNALNTIQEQRVQIQLLEETLKSTERLVVNVTPKQLRILIPPYIFNSDPERKPKLHLTNDERMELIKIARKVGDDIAIFNKETREFKTCTNTEWDNNLIDKSIWIHAFSYSNIEKD